jgi:hypothetical protein
MCADVVRSQGISGSKGLAMCRQLSGWRHPSNPPPEEYRVDLASVTVLGMNPSRLWRPIALGSHDNASAAAHTYGLAPHPSSGNGQGRRRRVYWSIVWRWS